MLKVALIGCGAIGTTLAKAIDKNQAGEVRLLWLYDLKPEKSEALAKKLCSKSRVAGKVEEIYKDKTVDLVIETASQLAVKQYSLDILRSGKDIMVMSVGAFGDKKLLEDVRRTAEKNGRRIYIPSGAILGVDGVKAAQLVGIKEVTLITKKPPEALAYSIYLKKRNIELRGLKKPLVVFSGSARQAIKAFPESVNVAATLSLSGTGLDKTKVQIVADPRLKRNVHEVYIKSKAGEFITISKNVPFPDNPRTSYMAALSAIRTLRNLTETIRIGA